MERVVNQLYATLRMRLGELTHPPIRKADLPVIEELTSLMDSLMHREFEGVPDAAFSLEKDKLDIDKAYKPCVTQGNYLCICGATIWWSNRLRHLSTKTHAFWMEMNHHEESREKLVQRALKRIEEETCPNLSTTTSSRRKARAPTAKSRARRTTGASAAVSSSARSTAKSHPFDLGTTLKNISRVLRNEEATG